MSGRILAALIVAVVIAATLIVLFDVYSILTLSLGGLVLFWRDARRLQRERSRSLARRRARESSTRPGARFTTKW